ncbi:Anaphase-promoting complex subunit 1 [Holothuria leucospilota]|uniref:Anaphase-promoting complex subunit 1 n=1 Tax=Holothuria leucospilota TaxID=206669 RepID=A0A9Q1CJI9_HOLLE|nr:Anaphase-promoting complex subunit 1 [Holothuria leucospilota]
MNEQRENLEPEISRGKCGKPPTKSSRFFRFDSADYLKLEVPQKESDMIAASEPEEFVPLGCSTYQQHPGKHLYRADDSRKNDLSKSHTRWNQSQEHWVVRKIPTSGVSSKHNEELYYRDKTVIWTQGCSTAASKLQKSFTTEQSILQALFATFTSEVSTSSSGNTSAANKEVEIPSVCIVHETGLTVIAESGEEFYCSLPFVVKRVWPIDGKLLIERAITKKDLSTNASKPKDLPTLFSLKHPLDEPSPMLVKAGGLSKLQFMQDPSVDIVFSCSNPDIVVTFDLSLGLHSVWSLRQTKTDELNTAMKLMDSTVGSALLPSFSATPRGGNQTSGTLAGLSSSAHSRLSASSVSSAAFSPATFRHHYTSSRAASPLVSSRPHTPAALSVSAGKSINQSSVSGHMTPSLLHRSSMGTANSPVMSILATPCADINEPLTPDLCLELGWTESSGWVGVLNKASKVFISQDLCEQKYLCFLVRQHQQLQCLKFSDSNDRSQLIFGSVTNLPAHDAVSLESLDMMVVLDPAGSLVLYTGLVKISRILVPGIQQVLENRLSTSSRPRPSTPLESHVFTATPSSANFVHADDDQVMLLSPVEANLSQDMDSSLFSEDLSFSSSVTGSNVKALRDALGDKFTLMCSGGMMLTTTVPAFSSSPVVKLCLDALKKSLPREVAMLLMTKWYTTHNAPGNDNGETEWIKFASCLLSLIGYKVNQLTMFQQDSDTSTSPVVAAKKHKPSGWDEDWEYLLGSSYHQQAQKHLPHGEKSSVFLPGVIQQESKVTQQEEEIVIDTSAPLFLHTPSIAFVLHLVYEETKLHRLYQNAASNVASLACQVAKDLGWKEYAEYYCRLHPSLVSIVKEEHSQFTQEQRNQLQEPSHFSAVPPCFNRWLCNTILGNQQEPFPCMDSVCKRTHQLLAVYSLYFNKIPSSIQFVNSLFRRLSLTVGGMHSESTSHLVGFVNRTMELTSAQRTVLYMSEIGLTSSDIVALPISLSLPLHQAVVSVRENPPSGWPESAYSLLVRKDLSTQREWLQTSKDCLKEISVQSKPDSKGKSEETDGMEGLDDDLLKFRFPDDLRVAEVKKLLQSSKPVVIALTQKPEVSDHEFLEQQEMRLLQVSQRTMALPVARGMFTLHTCRSAITEPLPVPKLNLSGRAPPRNTSIVFQHIDVPENVNAWPSFHNGVAAGLQLSPNDSKIDSAWIVYNQPQTKNLTNEFGGFLMALGLTGHLTKVVRMVLHNYLCSGHEMTGIGLAIGLAAAKRGTMDVSVTKILSIHIGALLPPTSTELAVPHNLQVAAILGIGLVYQGTAHRHMAEVLLGEIGRPPGPELENCTDRESYSLAAGLALGMVLLKHGSDAVGLSDLELANHLFLYMAGGHKKPLPNNLMDTGKSPCYQIQEGDQVNVDVTSPGATLALGLMFLQTGNKAVAQWLAAPETPYLLEFVKPDFLLLRTLSRGLILWDDIRPTEDWVNSNIPLVVQKYAMKKLTAQEEAEEEIDGQTMSQSSCCIMAGACMAMGLRFAGTANNAAFECLMMFAERCVKLGSQPTAELVGKASIEKCLNTVCMSLAMVMAGTGNLRVLRLARALRSRVSDDVTYGSHMAISSMIGLLFLGGGRYSLSNSPEAVAALLCSFYPVFPNNSKDNRYHLQALRHLYVLAAEPRLILPKEVSSGEMCYVPLEITFKKTLWHDEHSVQMLAPCIIPELNLIKQLCIVGSRYMPITLKPETDLQLLKKILQLGGLLFVKQRAGHLSYAEDPKGYKGLLAQSFTHDATGGFLTDPKLIHAFTSDPRMLNFSKMFCESRGTSTELHVQQVFSCLMFECIIQEKISLLPSLLEIYSILGRLSKDLCPSDIWQLKLILALASQDHVSTFSKVPRTKAQLISYETCEIIQADLETLLTKWLKERREIVLRYLTSGKYPDDFEDCKKLACFLTFFDLPSAEKMSPMEVSERPQMADVFLTARTLGVPLAVIRILQVVLKQER